MWSFFGEAKMPLLILINFTKIELESSENRTQSFQKNPKIELKSSENSENRTQKFQISRK